MDSKKILSLSKKICDVESILSIVNSGESFSLSISDGGTPVSILIDIKPDKTTTYKMSEEISKMLTSYHHELIRDILSAVRP